MILIEYRYIMYNRYLRSCIFAKWCYDEAYYWHLLAIFYLHMYVPLLFERTVCVKRRKKMPHTHHRSIQQQYNNSNQII
jgi:hypothetical protein